MSARRAATGWLPMMRVFVEVDPCVGIEVFKQLPGREAEPPVSGYAGLYGAAADREHPS
jgi:hypothetical protein